MNHNRIAKYVASIWRKAIFSPASLDGLQVNKLDTFETILYNKLLGKFSEDKLTYFCMKSMYATEEIDVILKECFDQAGIGEEAYPWHTMVSLTPDYISVTSSYISETVYHHPLNKNRWLITTLHGSEIIKILNYVNYGYPIDFKIIEGE